MNTPRSVTPAREAGYRRRSRAGRAAALRAPSRLAARRTPRRPDPDERRRGLERQGRVTTIAAYAPVRRVTTSVPDFRRASSTSSAVSRWRRASFAAMIAT